MYLNIRMVVFFTKNITHTVRDDSQVIYAGQVACSTPKCVSKPNRFMFLAISLNLQTMKILKNSAHISVNLQ